MKLTPEIHEKIVAMIREGNYRETASAACGITSRTFRNWMARGHEGEEPFAALAIEVDKAEAESEALDVAQLAKAAKDDWKAAAWKLERRWQHRWGRTPDIIVQNNAASGMPLVHLTVEQQLQVHQWALQQVKDPVERGKLEETVRALTPKPAGEDE